MPFPGWSGYAEHSVVTNPTATLTDFTFLISLNQMPAAWWAAVKADGGDIRVEKTDGTQLPLDVIRIDTGTTSGLIACKWTGSRTTGNTAKIRVWAGNVAASQPASGDTFGQFNAYDSNWRGFWPSGLGNDRTSFVNHLTAVGSPTVGGATGPINGSLATDLNGSTQYGQSTISVPTAAPLSMFASGHSDTDASLLCALSISDTATNTRDFLLVWDGGTGGDPIGARTREGAALEVAVSDTGFNTSSYFRGAARFASASSRIAYIDGDGGTELTTSITPTGIDTISVGAKRQSAGAAISFFDGRLSLVSLHTIARAVEWFAYDKEMLDDADQSDFFGAWAWTPSRQHNMAGSSGRNSMLLGLSLGI